VFLNRSAVGAAQLDGVGDDSRQHGFEIEGGADRLTDFPEGFQLTGRPRQLMCACFQLFEQAHVLNSNDSLSGESLEQVYLSFREWPDFSSTNKDSTDCDTLLE